MDPKYLNFLDQETREFIRNTEDLYPADAIHASIDQQRQFYDDLCRAFDLRNPMGIAASDRTVATPEGSVLVRQYTPATPPGGHVLFFHGGGFVVGGLESHDSICAQLCGLSGCQLTAVDYRLAPEYRHPAAFDDCLSVFDAISEEMDLPLILVGDSAGGNLAAAVAHARKPHAALNGQVLIYPALGGDTNKGSYVEHANAPLLKLDDIKFYEEMRSGGRDISGDPTANPLSDRDFSGLPATIIVTAACDPLADDGSDYCKRIVEAGGKAKWINETGLVHGYLRARSTVKRAEVSFARIADAISMLADKRWESA